MRPPMQSNVDELIVDVKEGDILAGKYRVDRVLGVGGMGIVVQATHTVLNDRVALKFLLPELLENEATAARFLREAQATVRIKSPHVARVTDVGKLENGAPYMVMEFLDGRDLGRVLEDGPLDVETAILYLLQACEAVAAAHASGVIHRDIKPANLFLTQGPDQRPVLKMLDFGISKIANRDGVGSLTQTHTAMGSPLYMSPEQMRSAKSVDARTDVWSLGIVLYEMLTGTLPFMADTMPQLCALILETEPPSLKDAVPDLPEGLDEAVRKAIARNMDDRYQDIAEFALAVGPFAGSAGIESARRVARILQAAGLGSDSGNGPLSVMPRPAPVASTSTAFGGTSSSGGEGSQRKWLLALAAGGIAVISLSAAWAIYRISSPDPAPAAVTAETETTRASAPSAATAASPTEAPVTDAAASASASAATSVASPAPTTRPAATTPHAPPRPPPTQTGHKPNPVNLDDRE
jgi:serine/threonine protein kinase